MTSSSMAWCKTQTRMREDNGGKEGRGGYLILIGHHVPQPLIINNSEKDVCLKLSAICPTVHPFRAIEVVTSYKKKRENSIFFTRKTGPALKRPFHGFSTFYIDQLVKIRRHRLKRGPTIVNMPSLRETCCKVTKK